ncbi:hypothetical protein M0R45_019651 [Rubus argutus]|uniref:Uncharacterized protein n=1 Tax=Rubus argutus TaxID=59490 RepID=A0AAW1X6W5_RUBAR
MASVLPSSKANEVLRLLEQEGVRIALDDSCRSQTINAIESLLNKYKKSGWRFIINIIVSTARKELLKSREIDVNIIKHVVGLILDKIRRARSVRLARLKKLVKEVEVEVEDQDQEEEDEGEGEGEEEDEEDEDEGEEEEEEEEDANDCIAEMLKCCSKMGCSLKKGPERQMVDQIILYRRIYKYGTVLGAISFLMNKNIVSTKEEGIVTPMNQLKQEAEKRECRDVELEECEIATPLNLPDQGENMVKVNFCLTQPECEDIETEECGSAMRGGANKRKLPQLELGY